MSADITHGERRVREPDALITGPAAPLVVPTERPTNASATSRRSNKVSPPCPALALPASLRKTVRSPTTERRRDDRGRLILPGTMRC
jgi:hypothetical protein